MEEGGGHGRLWADPMAWESGSAINCVKGPVPSNLNGADERDGGKGRFRPSLREALVCHAYDDHSRFTHCPTTYPRGAGALNGYAGGARAERWAWGMAAQEE